MRDYLIKKYVKNNLILLEKKNKQKRIAITSSPGDNITWGDMQDFVNARSTSKKSISIFKTISRALTAGSIEYGINLGMNSVEVLNSFGNEASGAFAEEYSSSEILNKLKQSLKKIGNSAENRLGNILLGYYQKKSGSSTDDTFMKNLIIDEETSKIIDDKIEIKFLEQLSKWIISNNSIRKQKIKNFSINDLLKRYLRENYSGRRIEGYK